MSKTGRKAANGTRRRKARVSPKGAMWPWYVTGLMVICGTVAYDNMGSIRGWFRSQSHAVASGETTKHPKKHDGEARTAAIPAPGQRPVAQSRALATEDQVMPAIAPPMDIGTVQTVALRTAPTGSFYFCTDQKTNCVIDGGHFFLDGRKISLADISLPQMKKAKCDAERELGSRAKRRLREILNMGEFKLLAVNSATTGDGTSAMHVVLNDGTLISDRLIAEGLAHTLKDAGKPWC